MNNPFPRFHLAFPVTDIEATRRFYVDMLGCRVGREAARWIDFDFFGHQISAHLVERLETAATNPVDGDNVPVHHFGAILEWNDWHALAERLQSAHVEFIIKPHVRFVDQPGEQATLFICDPSGNALEFKAFRNQDAIFAR
ncbi:MAG TPA: VOC family protein [Gammaproteobacteria bacterium]|jgi:extradiol dioxygenase family protein|nr:VOC family protein [Gammaproteobacteria bacterium]